MKVTLTLLKGNLVQQKQKQSRHRKVLTHSALKCGFFENLSFLGQQVELAALEER